MPRLSVLDENNISADIRPLYDDIMRRRQGQGLPNSYKVLMRSPGICEKWFDLGYALRYETSLSQALAELVMIIATGQYRCQHAFYTHAIRGKKEGLSPDIIEALRQGKEPSFSDPVQKAVYDLASEVAERADVSDEKFEAVRALLGERALVEIIAIAGYYVMLSAMMNSLRIAMPGGAAPPFEGVGRA
jgi:4-carboxymuconolactone decarboxylase